MKKNAFLILIVVLSSIIAIPALARDFSINFGARYFACKVHKATKSNTQILFQTHHVNARGFTCKNTPDQHRGSAKLTADEVRNVYFIIEPSLNASMTVTPDDAIVTCESNNMGHNSPYRKNDQFCSTPSPEENE